jgi:hypothetical protein
MNEPQAEFKRLLMRLPHSPRDYAGVRFAADLAELLGASFVATFAQDAELAGVATLSCVRELHPLGGGWHQIEAPQLAAQLERRAAAARRLFDDAVRQARIEATFSATTESIADAIGRSAAVGDIIAIVEPRNPAERVTQQFTQLVDTAFGARAAIMVIPGRIVRNTGPIAAILSGPADAGIQAALALAAAAKEKMIALAPPGALGQQSMAERADAAGVSLEVGPIIRQPFNASSLLPQLDRLNERLVVISRGMIDDRDATRLASLRGIPVLLARKADAARS